MQGAVDIAIIGAGASGLLVAAAVAETRPDLQVALIDHRLVDGGLAYAEAGPAHLLNVPARAMGANPERPAAFLEWAREHRDPALTGDEFLPRRWYGQYLVEQIAGRDVHRIGDEVIGVVRRGFRWELRLAAAPPLTARAVVLALGNPPSTPLGAEASSPGHIIERPFDEGALAQIEPADSVLVVGTGLTAVDVVMDLDRRRHEGPIRLVSRSGLLPSSHCGQGRCPYHSLGSGTDIRPISPQYRQALQRGGPAEILRALRTEIGRRPEQCWQSSLDLLMRHELAGLWDRWGDDARRRFLGRLSSRYDRVRHRMPPPAARRLGELMKSGQVSVERANVSRVLETDAGPVVVPVAGCASATADWVVNAKGPDLRTPAYGPLVTGLVEARCARPGWGGLGIDVDADGRVLEVSGLPAQSLYALGPLCRGARWETTAMAEVRVQAAHVALVAVNDATPRQEPSSPGAPVAGSTRAGEPRSVPALEH